MAEPNKGEAGALCEDALVVFEMWCREHHDRQPAYVTRRQETGLALLVELRRLRAVVEEPKEPELDVALRVLKREKEAAIGREAFWVAANLRGGEWMLERIKAKVPNPTTGAE